MIFNDKAFDALVWLTPARRGEWKVYVGDNFLVMRTYNQALAEETVKNLKEAAIRGIKQAVVDLAPRMCELCRKGEKVRARKTVWGWYKYAHWSQHEGWQPCAAEDLWRVMIDDTKERKQKSNEEGVA